MPTNKKKFSQQSQPNDDTEMQQENYNYDENEYIYPHFSFNFNSKDEYKQQEQFYERRSAELIEQLNELEKIGSSLNSLSSIPTPASANLAALLKDLNRLEKESNEDLTIMRTCFDKQKYEIEQQYLNEYKKAIQEYQDKRKELKENLKNEQEEMKKQIEIDRTSMDINMDITDAKPAPTRNLRRRNPNAMQSSYDFSADGPGIDAASTLISSSTVTGSILLQNTLIGGNIINSVSLNGASIAGSSVNASFGLSQTVSTSIGSYYSTINQQTFFSSINNSLLNSQNANERKRKLSPSAITFSINEEDINEDLKFLIKNINNPNYNPKQQSSIFSLPSSSSSSSTSSPKPFLNSNEQSSNE